MWNGSGTFLINSTGQPVVASTVISSTVFNAFTADIATGLTNCITKDGQQTVTADIPWNSNKITGLGAATTNGDALSLGNMGSLSLQMAKLGLGMSPTNILDITQTQNTTSQGKILNSNAGTAAAAAFVVDNGTSNASLLQLGTGFTPANGLRADGTALSGGGAGGVTIKTSAAQPIYFVVSNTDRGRVTSTGQWLWNLLAFPVSTAQAGLGFAGNATNGLYLCDTNTSAGTDTPIAFLRGTTFVGEIDTTLTTTSYVTSSDERLKDNIADAADAGAIIDALKVRAWDWKLTGDHEDYGFVAQEEVAVYPPAVRVGDDDPTTITKAWGRDDAKLVPLVVKEIQSLRARLAAARI